MKVMDLLQRIANEEAPENIKYNGTDYYLFDKKSYLTTDKSRFFDSIYFKELNDEVEIIEEDKKIRKLDFIEENTFSIRQNGMTSEDRRLLDSNFRELGNKINEIIDYLEENQ